MEPMRPRTGTVRRTTSETDIELTLCLDGAGAAEVGTGIGFLDHMLTLFAHHTVEDIGLALGQALREALGDKRGIVRYGSFLLPMDEALALVAVDLSGRPFLAHNLELAGVRIGEFEADLTAHFFRSLVNQAGITLHIRMLAGEDPHHIVEAAFKGTARALAEACGRHGRDDAVPSSKGTL